MHSAVEDWIATIDIGSDTTVNNFDRKNGDKRCRATENFSTLFRKV